MNTPSPTCSYRSYRSTLSFMRGANAPSPILLLYRASVSRKRVRGKSLAVSGPLLTFSKYYPSPYDETTCFRAVGTQQVHPFRGGRHVPQANSSQTRVNRHLSALPRHRASRTEIGGDATGFPRTRLSRRPGPTNIPGSTKRRPLPARAEIQERVMLLTFRIAFCTSQVTR